jgi:hypothetical protein
MRWLLLILFWLLIAFAVLWSESLLMTLFRQGGELIVAADGTALKVAGHGIAIEHGTATIIGTGRPLVLMLLLANGLIGVLALVGAWKVTARRKPAA